MTGGASRARSAPGLELPMQPDDVSGGCRRPLAPATDEQRIYRERAPGGAHGVIAPAS